MCVLGTYFEKAALSKHCPRALELLPKLITNDTAQMTAWGHSRPGPTGNKSRQCPLLRRKRKEIQAVADVAVSHCGLMALTET
jgi:hypothetical protein